MAKLLYVWGNIIDGGKERRVDGIQLPFTGRDERMDRLHHQLHGTER